MAALRRVLAAVETPDEAKGKGRIEGRIVATDGRPVEGAWLHLAPAVPIARTSAAERPDAPGGARREALEIADPGAAWLRADLLAIARRLAEERREAAAQETLTRETATDARGAFAFEGLPAIAFTVTAEHPWFLFRDARTPDRGTPIERAPDCEDVLVVATPLGRVRFAPRLPGGGVASSARVELRPGPQPPGRFEPLALEQTIPAGRYEARAGAVCDGEPFWSPWVAFEAPAGGEVAVELPLAPVANRASESGGAGAPDDGAPAAAEAARRLTLVAVDETGAPVGEAVWSTSRESWSGPELSLDLPLDRDEPADRVGAPPGWIRVSAPEVGAIAIPLSGRAGGRIEARFGRAGAARVLISPGAASGVERRTLRATLHPRTGDAATDEVALARSTRIPTRSRSRPRASGRSFGITSSREPTRRGSPSRSPGATGLSPAVRSPSTSSPARRPTSPSRSRRCTS
jgi:hypothetical protein